MALTSSVVAAFAIGLLTLFYLAARQPSKGKSINNRNQPLLKLPLIGDLHRSPIDKPLANWDAWARQNGPIAVPRLFGIIPIVVLNSLEAATELFSRRSPWYSNRPASVSMEMITGAEPGRSRFTLMHDYDEHLKLHHRILAPSLGALAAPRYQPLMELEGKQLLFDLCNALRRDSDGTISTNAIYPLLERTQSSVILALHYGLRIPGCEEALLHEIIGTQAQVTHLAANPGLPDLIPPLRHLPAILSPWRRAADRLFVTQADLYMRLFRHGRDSTGWNATKQAIATAKKLPFIDAIAHELFRWRPISPGSIPRRADRDDEFQGVKIAKGVTVMANAWAIGRDESVFDPTLGDLNDFVPERWLQNGKDKLRTDLPLPVFGQGRRICQGKRIATDGMFMQVANLLWAFDIEPADGVIMDPWTMSVVGFMTMPTELSLSLRPRGP
ncbi:cytochrome P450 [Aspergillus sclerotiicarbonarius CBS 121057]|uniref:Cytochrome P450 n=1 Tax=Aspergillus sclerotiicarbonarius (strain CBS 121057 / IBT 28362) TaxID=1448318 RepID=A0A319E1N1_ASPSB|nr:cytochrome P450 [Aspergillus sclerotiicarbonarius CBS 121057]